MGWGQRWQFFVLITGASEAVLTRLQFTYNVVELNDKLLGSNKSSENH